jgi:hypothetical protein
MIDELGGQGQNRTADTKIFSLLLYRLSYLPIVWEFYCYPSLLTVASRAPASCNPAFKRSNENRASLRWAELPDDANGVLCDVTIDAKAEDHHRSTKGKRQCRGGPSLERLLDVWRKGRIEVSAD